MIVLLDTSSGTCKLTLIDDNGQYDYEWEAGRGLAKGLLKYIDNSMNKHDHAISGISGIGVFRGPGSFTGLRIGLTVMNTIADAQSVPIVGAVGDDWQLDAVTRLKSGDDDKIVLPLYDRDANISTPRK
ncbi:tRNA (adenosine(37)-N6)-threonylcarbamoyltransferase complex dimerization subunit type 1 TsaB [Candidatus Saccharibacteria bacterium]|nr:tRNA (adenosine(37)-N6)-threonylcarbamoyltransferase complex dimerization subunit type 1 TsaB [Candidatus Saccharibacteria bacterium]